MRRCLCFILLLLTASLHAEKVEEYFLFDRADETVPATVLDNPLYYDAGIAPTTNGVWLAWLEYIPGKGDQLWLGLRREDKWISKKLLSETPGDLANPTPTIDASGRLWISYEKATATNWSIVVQQISQADFKMEGFNDTFAGINHRVIAGADGSVTLVFQREQKGRFEAYAANLAWTNNHSSLDVLAIGAGWRPAVAISPTNGFHFVGDVYDGNSYNVFFQPGTFSPRFYLAQSLAFEAHAQIASDKNGRLYTLWEEDGENWGKHYLSREPGDKKSTRMVDNEGPLHRFRQLHLAELDPRKNELKEYELPQVSFELAAKRTNAPAGFKNFGVFYENGQLVVDGLNRLWIVYRHFYAPWIGLVPETHKQDNMRIYARCLLPDGWSKLYSFSEGQGDGMQRIHVAPTANGIAVAYTFGRTDRRKGEVKRGVAWAEIQLEKGSKMVSGLRVMDTRSLSPGSGKDVAPADYKSAALSRSAVKVDGKKYELFFGDMHRHTDISLCFSPADGTIEDAYRYAIDVAPLDFLGITDHTHDLDMGNGLSLIWHRSRKEVNRHALTGRFIPLFSYERSRGDTDHNVFSLYDNVLKPHTYPLTQFWEEIDTNTFTVPHQPFNAVTWKYKDDAHRPLLEIYQGFRNDAREDAAHQGLLAGHHFGFIAASDHLSTGGSFACVWAEKPERESLFRAMQARRTYAATAKIELRVTCGEHWMGERFAVKKMPPIKVFAKGTDAIAKLDLFVDAALKSSVTDLTQSKQNEVKWEVPTDESLTGAHIFHIRVTQKDGNRAWSSPMWVEIQ